VYQRRRVDVIVLDLSTLIFVIYCTYCCR